VDVLFVMKHPGVVRNMESTIRLLAERGHGVHLAFEATKAPAAEARVEELAVEYDRITFGRAPAAKGPWADVARAARLGRDYLRYLEPRYAGASKLRLRAAAQTPAPLRRVAALPGGKALLRRVLPVLERALPPSPAAVEFVRSHAPDVLLVSPLIGLGSSQADYLRAARVLGVPVVFPVHSWDNLTNKGLLRDIPDLTLVWNQAQVDEAIDLHGVPPERVEATGAAPYDHWFEWEPSSSPVELAELTGLPAGRPFVLWVCSSPFIAPDEVSFVRRWVDALRASGPPLAEVGVLVRPHPQNAAQWDGVTFEDEAVAIWPPLGEDPLDADGRRHYFDSIHHAAAVVGINTSAQIEGAVLGRPVHTVLAPEFRGTQEGTLHFRYIAGDEGHLIVGRSLAEHVEQLAASLERPDSERGRRFLRAFVRPHGLDVPATPRVVAAIERAAGAPALEPVPEPPGAAAVRAALAPAVRRLRRRRRAAKAHRRLDGAARAAAELDRLAGSDGPVLAGPWLAEVGYELLYWIPFLRRATERVPGLAERLVVVSRGGTQPWYDGIAQRYLDVFDELPAELLEQRLQAIAGETRGYRKQYAETSFDRQLLAALEGRIEGRAELLHPATMFGAYRSLAKAGLRPEQSGLFSYERLPEPPLPEDLADVLPPSYAAVRFYFSEVFPDTTENRALAAEAVRGLADHGDVVVLAPPGRYDEHRDLELPLSPRVHVLAGAMTPQDNLAIQTAVIARARAFVGTYGGLSYLPLLLGVPAAALYSKPRFRRRHLDLAIRLSARPGFAAYDAHLADGLELEPLLRELHEPATSRRRE
jgi:hypothetical protein